MAVEQCIAQLREIEAQIDKARTTNLIFAAKEKGDPPSFSIKHAQIHQRLVADFKAISKRAAKSLCESNLISYDTGYKLDSGDVMYFDLKSRQPIKELIDNVKDIDSLGLIKKDDNYFKNISFYGIYHSLGNQDILCLSGISPQNILKKSKKIGLFVQDGLYDRVEEDSLIINREIHCIAFKEYLFI